MGELDDPAPATPREPPETAAAARPTAPETPQAPADGAPLEAPAAPAEDDDAPRLEDRLTAEELAVLPMDTPLSRLLGDRRVRLTLIIGLPVMVAVFMAVGILASNINLSYAVTVEGPPALPPGAATSLRVGFSEMNGLQLPVEVAIHRAKLEICPPEGGACEVLGEVRDCGRGRDVEIPIRVPAWPAGDYRVRVEVVSAERTVHHAFTLRLDPEARTPSARRADGRMPPVELGRSGVIIDLLPVGSGALGGLRSPLLLRARDSGGEPWTGTLHLLPLGGMLPGVVPAELVTDDLGLATFDVQTEMDQYRLAISTRPFPALDPIEVDTGLLPLEVLETGAVVECTFSGGLARMTLRPPATPEGDNPFFPANATLGVAFSREDLRTQVLFEVWRDGRLLHMASGTLTRAEQRLPGLTLSPGLSFVQAHAAGGLSGSVVGRHFWTADDTRPAANLAPLLDAAPLAAGDAAWARAVRARQAGISEPQAARVAYYLLGRLDGIYYEYGVLFDSRPGQVAEAERLQGTIQTVMASALVVVGVLFVAAALVVVLATLQVHRRQRSLGTRLPSASAAEGDVPVAVYDRVSWLRQYSVLINGFFVFLILAATMGGLALLVWVVRAMYWRP